MTIYKANNPQKTDKELLEKKLLAEVELESECRPAALEVQLLAVQRRRSKLWLNIFLILVALLVLAAGITGGVLLYKRLSHKIYKGEYRFTTTWTDETQDIPRDDLKDYGTPHAMAQDDKAKVEESKAHKHKPTPAKQHKYQMKEDVQVIDDKVEKIHMPSFKELRDTLILHDFEKNFSVIVDFQLKACYVMKLDRKQVSPPRDWIDLIQKFATGYYMPNANILRKKYRVMTPAVRNTEQFGRYISSECLYYKTYMLEKMVGDHRIFKRAAGGSMQWGTYGYYEPRTGEFKVMSLFK